MPDGLSPWLSDHLDLVALGGHAHAPTGDAVSELVARAALPRDGLVPLGVSPDGAGLVNQVVDPAASVQREASGALWVTAHVPYDQLDAVADRPYLAILVQLWEPVTVTHVVLARSHANPAVLSYELKPPARDLNARPPAGYHRYQGLSGLSWRYGDERAENYCLVHRRQERSTPGDYLVCLECNHVYHDETELVEADLHVRLRLRDVATLVERLPADQVTVCPHCFHDL